MLFYDFMPRKTHVPGRELGAPSPPGRQLGTLGPPGCWLGAPGPPGCHLGAPSLLVRGPLAVS